MAKHYHAFISYAHDDERWARWLQRSLENYRVPSKLTQQFAGRRSLPARLNPIFRDRDEFASSADLSRSIRAALDSSGALIVICSPTAAGSRWVNEEIRHFQARGLEDRIFCVLVDGSPERDASDCAFPPALLFSAAGSACPDPLAADIRTTADGKRGAMLKIAAALLNVGIDDLRQRDTQRKLRLRGAVAAASLMLAVLTIGLAISAELAREEADIRRAQAESMIGFMLGDLRAKLEPVGRLDLLDAVGDEAMSYFAELAEQGTEQEVFSRAMALRQIGEVRFRQGRLEPAAEAFEESRNVAMALHTASPDNLEYLFELGQAEFWLGYVALEQSQLGSADSAFQKYMEYSRSLLKAEPGNPDFQLELSYAYNNLGAVALQLRKPENALAYFDECIALNKVLVDAEPAETHLRHELGNAYSWLGAALLQLGRLEQSEAAYTAAVQELSVARAASDNALLSENYGQNVYHLGNVKANRGKLTEALSLFAEAHTLFEGLVAHDAENAIWLGDRGISAYFRAELLRIIGERDQAVQLVEAAIGDFQHLLAGDPEDLRSIEHLALAERLAAILAFDDSSLQEAVTLARRAQERMSEITGKNLLKPRTLISAGRVAEGYGQMLRASGNEAGASAVWQDALDLLRAYDSRELEQIAIELKIVAFLKGENPEATHQDALVASGFEDPRFR